MFCSGTKVAQAAKFNDPNDPCEVLVATDAVGMGLNLYVFFLYIVKWFTSFDPVNMNKGL